MTKVPMTFTIDYNVAELLRRQKRTDHTFNASAFVESLVRDYFSNELGYDGEGKVLKNEINRDLEDLEELKRSVALKKTRLDQMERVDKEKQKENEKKWGVQV